MTGITKSLMLGAMLVAQFCWAGEGGETRQLKPEPVREFKLDDGRTLRLESLGRPLPAKTTNVEFVTDGPGGDRIAWGALRATIEHYVVGYGEKGGLHLIDVTKYFGPHSYKQTIAPAGDSIYILAGNRGPALLKYHIPTRKTTELKHFKTRYYWLGHAVDSRGRIYWATYPETEVIGIDPATDEIFTLGRMSEAAEQSYALSPAADDDDILYVPVGQSRTELYAYNLKTGKKRQILTDDESRTLRQNHRVRIPRVQRVNGKVYTRFGSKTMLCTFDGLREAPGVKIGNSNNPNAKFPSVRFNDREDALRFDEYGLVLSDGKSTRTIPIAGLPLIGHELYSIGSDKDGVLYGSGIFPANSFQVDLKTLVATDFGMVSGGGVQNYDLRWTPYGILMCSYTGGYFDLLDPAKPIQKGVNPKRIGDLRAFDQERPIRLTPVGDASVLYVGSIPAKNTLGGAITRIDLNTGKLQVWRPVIPDQSILDLVPVPGGRLLFGGSSIQGGTGTTPAAKHAVIFLFDPERGETVWTGDPMKGQAQHYQGSMLTGDGRLLIIGRGQDTRWFLFDPAKREVVKSGDLGRSNGRFIFADFRPVGPDKRNYFSCNGELFEYNPKTETVVRLMKDPSLNTTGYLSVAENGYLHFLDECRLMRVRVFQPEARNAEK